MADLIITDLSGQSELLTGYKNLKRTLRVNGITSLSFLLFKTDNNSHSYDLVEDQAILEYEGQKYRIKKILKRVAFNTLEKQVEAYHIMYDLADNRIYDKTSGVKTIQQALDFALAGSPFSYNIIEAFSPMDLGEFGDANSINLLNIICESYGVEIQEDNYQLNIRKQIGVDAGVQIRRGYNLKELSFLSETNNLSTFIRGYGKKREGTDILSGTKIAAGSREGEYLFDEELVCDYTVDVGATFSFSFTGTGFNFETILNFLGGEWEFIVDGKENKRISTFSEEMTTQTIEVFRGLEHGNHTVIARFMGEDSSNPYTEVGGVPRVYLKNGNIIGIYRAMQPEEIYPVYVEYTSPNAAVYGIKHAEPLRDDNITSNEELLNRLKKVLIDTPEITITVSFADMKKAGYSLDTIGKGDVVHIIDEMMGIEYTSRVMEAVDYPDINNKTGITVTLANHKKGISNYFQAEYDQIKKSLRTIVDNKGVVRYDVLPEAMKRSTEALQNAQTELQFPESGGIHAVDPNNPNNLTVFRSTGIGISRDGGQNFQNAITANGFNLEIGAIGELSANNVDVSGVILAINSEGSTMIDGGKIALGSNSEFTQLDLDVNTANSNASTALSNAQSAYGLASSANSVANSANNTVNLWKYPNTTYINGGNIFTGTVTANHMNVSNLSAISANLGTVTAGNISSSTTIDVGTDLKVGNNVYLGAGYNGMKSIVLNSLARINSSTNNGMSISSNHTEVFGGDITLGSSGHGSVYVKQFLDVQAGHNIVAKFG
ncbi:MAG: phage tail spike protein [Bacillota bacterium]